MTTLFLLQYTESYVSIAAESSCLHIFWPTRVSGRTFRVSLDVCRISSRPLTVGSRWPNALSTSPFSASHNKQHALYTPQNAPPVSPASFSIGALRMRLPIIPAFPVQTGLVNLIMNVPFVRLVWQRTLTSKWRKWLHVSHYRASRINVRLLLTLSHEVKKYSYCLY